MPCSRVRGSAYLVFSGADGSGKTTVVRLLASYLSSRGSTCVHWFRGTHLLASLLSRFLSRFSSFRGFCNPYYGTCIPRKLRWLWVHIEFWSLIPHVLTRFLLRLFCDILVCDRGFLDFIVWVITTLNKPEFLGSLYGRFAIRLVLGEKPIYLYADAETLTKRADTPRDFITRELAVYNTLVRNLSMHSINSGKLKPASIAGGVLRCLEEQ